jgi:hypothetical protein
MGDAAMPSDPLARLSKSLDQINQLVNRIPAQAIASQAYPPSLSHAEAMERIEQHAKTAETHLLRAAQEIEERLSACEAEIKALKQQRAEG